MLFAKETFHYSFVWAARLLSKEGENGIAIPETRRALHLFGVVKRCRALPESLEHSTLLCAMCNEKSIFTEMQLAIVDQVGQSAVW